MKTRFLLITFMFQSVAACASDISFKSDLEFSAYISTLGLSDLTVQLAMSRLIAEGFKCYPLKDAVSCMREDKRLVCNQKQIVTLPSFDVSSSPLPVTSKLGLVCL